jgi:hypothetical protein
MKTKSASVFPGALFVLKKWLALKPRSALQRLGLIGALPGELDIVAAEATVGGRLAIDRLAQSRVTEDHPGGPSKNSLIRAETPFKSVSGFTARDLVLEYDSTFVSRCLTKMFVSLTHFLFRKVERAGNLRPILICVSDGV